MPNVAEPQTTSQLPISAPLYVSKKQAAKRAGVSESTFWREIAPRLTKYHFGQRCTRYSLAELDLLLGSMASHGDGGAA